MAKRPDLGRIVEKAIKEETGAKADIIGASTSQKEEVQASVDYYDRNRTVNDLREDFKMEAYRTKMKEDIASGEAPQEEIDALQDLGDVIKGTRKERDRMKPDEENTEEWKRIREKRAAIIKRIEEILDHTK